MNWLRGMLGLGDRWSSAEQRRHREFLADLAGDDRKPVDQFDDLLRDRKGGALMLREAGYGPVKEHFLEDMGLLHIAESFDLLAVIDWAAAPDEIFEAFAPLLKQRRLPNFPNDFLQFALEIEDAKRGNHVGLLFPKVVDWAAKHDVRVIDLNTGSDMYRFALVSPSLFTKWVGTKLSAAIKVEDPSWQFKT
jgi:hypothetical protein